MKTNLFISSVFFFLHIFPFNNVDAVATTIPAGESPVVCKVEKYEQCKEWPNTEVLFHDMSIYRVDKDKYGVKAIINTTKEMKAPLWMGAKIESCTETSCRHEMDQVLQDLCVEMDNKNSQGYDIMANRLAFPRPKCPLPSGTHEIDQVFEARNFMAVGSTRNKWKMTMSFLGDDKKTPKSCVYFELKMEPKNSKEKTKQLDFNKKTGKS